MGKRNLKTVSNRLFPFFFFFFPFFCKKIIWQGIDRKTEIETRKKNRKHFLFCVFSSGNWEINNRNENITENVFRFLFFAFRILCVPCSGRRKLKTEAEKKENVFVSFFLWTESVFFICFCVVRLLEKGKWKRISQLILSSDFRFFFFFRFPRKERCKTDNQTESGNWNKRIFSVLRSSFWQKRKNVLRKQFPFPFFGFSFSTEVELLFFLFCLPVSDKRRTRKRKLEYVFRSRFPLRFRVKENEKENRQAKTFSSYDFRFSVFVLLFSAVRTETENGKGIHYPFCVCRFGKSGKAKNVVLLRFSFGFPGNEKTQVSFLT